MGHRSSCATHAPARIKADRTSFSVAIPDSLHPHFGQGCGRPRRRLPACSCRSPGRDRSRAPATRRPEVSSGGASASAKPRRPRRSDALPSATTGSQVRWKSLAIRVVVGRRRLAAAYPARKTSRQQSVTVRTRPSGTGDWLDAPPPDCRPSPPALSHIGGGGPRADRGSSPGNRPSSVRTPGRRQQSRDRRLGPGRGGGGRLWGRVGRRRLRPRPRPHPLTGADRAGAKPEPRPAAEVAGTGCARGSGRFSPAGPPRLPEGQGRRGARSWRSAQDQPRIAAPLHRLPGIQAFGNALDRNRERCWVRSVRRTGPAS